MQPLATFCSSANEPVDYVPRPTVKAVVLDESKRVLLFSGSLLGGGVEKGETDEAALHRECLEEAGISIEIVKPLGIVIQFRDVLKKRYEIHGVVARYVAKVSEPTTTSESEKRRIVAWHTLPEAISMLEKSVEEFERANAKETFDDSYQARLYNAKTALIFLQEAAKGLQSTP